MVFGSNCESELEKALFTAECKISLSLCCGYMISVAMYIFVVRHFVYFSIHACNRM